MTDKTPDFNYTLREWVEMLIEAIGLVLAALAVIFFFAFVF